jgi:hypothetical protein
VRAVNAQIFGGKVLAFAQIDAHRLEIGADLAQRHVRGERTGAGGEKELHRARLLAPTMPAGAAAAQSSIEEIGVAADQRRVRR